MKKWKKKKREEGEVEEEIGKKRQKEKENSWKSFNYNKIGGNDVYFDRGENQALKLEG